MLSHSEWIGLFLQAKLNFFYPNSPHWQSDNLQKKKGLGKDKNIINIWDINCPPSTAQHETTPLYFLSVNKQILPQTPWLLLSLFWSSRALVYITLSSQNTLYLPLSLSQTRLSILPPVLLQVGHRAQTLWAASPASPPRCPLPLLSHRIRTRPSRTALSSEANTNQPQMFTLGEKGQQMRSHSIKLASLPLSLCLSLFRTFSLFLQSAKNPGELFRSVGVTTLLSGFICLIPSSFSAVSYLGFPLRKKRENSLFQFFRLPDT